MRGSLGYILKRLFLMIPTLVGISVVTFFLIHLAPGGPVDQRLNRIRFSAAMAGASTSSALIGMRGEVGVSKAVVDALRKQYGFDKPMFERYLLWIKKVFTLDFGNSFVYQKPVLSVIKDRLPVSLQFGICSLMLSYMISLGLGLFMAYHAHTGVDRFALFSLLASTSVPGFVIAIVLLVFLAGGSFLDLFPVAYLHSDNYSELSTIGKIKDRIHHFILPLTAYVAGGFAPLALLCRNSLLEVIKERYVDTARAKGLAKRAVFLKHAFRNALIPIVTGIGGIIGIFLTGSMLIESIFQLNGIGLLGYEAMLARDYNIIMALIFIGSVTMLLGNLIGDIAYMLVDPRIDYK